MGCSQSAVFDPDPSTPSTLSTPSYPPGSAAAATRVLRVVAASAPEHARRMGADGIPAAVAQSAAAACGGFGAWSTSGAAAARRPLHLLVKFRSLRHRRALVIPSRMPLTAQHFIPILSPSKSILQFLHARLHRQSIRSSPRADASSRRRRARREGGAELLLPVVVPCNLRPAASNL